MLRKILDLWSGEPDASVRCECSDLRWRLSSVNQRRLANGNLYWSKRIESTSCFDLFSHFDVLHRCDPWLIWWSPGWIKDDLLRLSQSRWQRELGIPNANLV